MSTPKETLSASDFQKDWILPLGPVLVYKFSLDGINEYVIVIHPSEECRPIIELIDSLGKVIDGIRQEIISPYMPYSEAAKITMEHVNVLYSRFLKKNKKNKN